MAEPPAPPLEGPRRLAEWAPQSVVYTAWPHLELEWAEDLDPARAEVAALVAAIAGAGEPAGARPGPPAARVRVLVRGPRARATAEAALAATPGVELVDAPYGDVWLRDIAPLFRARPDGGLDAVAFRFDGWGGKYTLDGDLETAEAVARAEGLPLARIDLVGEGGAVEVDGEGTCLTTRSCLLSPERNPSLDEAEVTSRLRAALGVNRVIWLERGLANDHTDGHVDTLARFVAPGRVALMVPAKGDPNHAVLDELRRDVSAARDAEGRALEVVEVPSPGAVLGRDGEPMPASYLNFLVTNGVVVVPTYGAPADDAAVAALAAAFPDRRVVGRSARAILSGGGAFHCITQEVPRAPREDRAP